MNKAFILSQFDYADAVSDQAYNSCFHENLESNKYNACFAIIRTIWDTSLESYVKIWAWNLCERDLSLEKISPVKTRLLCLLQSLLI